MVVRRKTAFHSSNRQNVRLLADGKQYQTIGEAAGRTTLVRRELQREQKLLLNTRASSRKRWFGFCGGSRLSID
jgi:hypothetical protein